MSIRYIREKNTPKKIATSVSQLIIKHWQIVLTAASFLFLTWVIKIKVPEALILQTNNTIISAASILIAVIITFLAARVTQIRQEKLTVWNDYHKLTQKVHHFRGAIYPLYASYDFWPDGLKFEMEHKYKSLTYFEVRKVVFVHGTELSALAEKFLAQESGPKSLYLQIRSFFKGNVPHDISMFSGEFDSHLYYDADELELWLTFECGHGLYYYFSHKYALYKNSFHFDKISPHDQQSIKDHCMRIDPDRYGNIPFGNRLYDLLGQQFTENFLPELLRLSRIVNGLLRGPVNQLVQLLIVLIPIGIICPFLVSLQLLPIWCSILSISGTLSLLIHIMLTLHKTFTNEIKVHPSRA